jgi:putative ABC transport system permease protein
VVSWLGPRGLALIVRRSLRQHLLSTLVTALSIALASGLTLAVFHILDQSQRAFTGGKLGFDAVLGARGSQLQLVLNAVFHLETSPGNIPWKLYQSIRAHPMVLRAIPYAVGDNYRGYRVVGTTLELFQDFEYQRGRRYELEAGGRLFDAQRREAVIGAVVARRTGLKRGDHFRPYHGLAFDANAQHEQVFEVVGVMRPTSTPADRVVWIPIEALYRIEGHVLRGGGETYTPEAGRPIPDEHREVSAVMLQFRSPQAGFALDQTINKQGRVATLAWPIAAVMADLFERLGWLSAWLPEGMWLSRIGWHRPGAAVIPQQAPRHSCALTHRPRQLRASTHRLRRERRRWWLHGTRRAISSARSCFSRSRCPPPPRFLAAISPLPHRHCGGLPFLRGF